MPFASGGIGAKIYTMSTMPITTNAVCQGYVIVMSIKKRTRAMRRPTTMIPVAMSNANSRMESITEPPASTALRIDAASVDQASRHRLAFVGLVSRGEMRNLAKTHLTAERHLPGVSRASVYWLGIGVSDGDHGIGGLAAFGAIVGSDRESGQSSSEQRGARWRNLCDSWGSDPEHR